MSFTQNHLCFSKKVRLYFFYVACLLAYNSMTSAYYSSSEFDRVIRSHILEDDTQDQLRGNTVGKESYLCVSLGFNCTVAINLDKHGLRKWAFPFDWNVTSLKGLCDVIENDFLDFLNPQYLDRRFCIYNNKYNLAFAHDFPIIQFEDGSHTEVPNYLDFLEDISKKYQRRIERFYKSCEMADTIYFFRLKSIWTLDTFPQDKNTIIRLRDVLINKFPAKNWILVAIDTDPEYKTDWHISMVKNFYIRGHAMEEDWRNIFRQLGLL